MLELILFIFVLYFKYGYYSLIMISFFIICSLNQYSILINFLNLCWCSD